MRLLALIVALALVAGGCAGDPTSRSERTPASDHSSRDRSDRRERTERGHAPPPARRWEPVAPIDPIPWHPAASARELADRLWVAEHQARAPYNRDAVVAGAAFEAQLLYRQLARTPAWHDAVIRRMRGLGDDVRLHIEARTSLRSVLTTLADEVPAWEIGEPAPTADLLRFYREGERVHGVAWELLAAINLVETGFGKIRGLSTAGAQGPMQFMPSTWAAYGEGDVDDPHDAVLGAANYLAANGAGTGATSGPAVENALYRYNNHPGYVAGILAYTSIIERDPRVLQELVRWQIVYLSAVGDLWLPIGYFEAAPVPAQEYVRRHPERLLGTVTD